MISPQRNPLPRPAPVRAMPASQQQPMRVLQTRSAPAQLSLFLRSSAALNGIR